MKKILKKIGVILVSASILTQIAGCVSDTAQKAEKALEEKYDKTVKVTKIGNFNNNSYNIFCKQGDVIFSARVDKDGILISDKYNEALLCKDIEEKISENVKDIAEDFVVKANVFGVVENYTPGNAEDVMAANPMMSFGIRIAVNDDEEINVEPDILYNSLTKAFNINHFNGSAEIAFVNDEDMKSILKLLEENPNIDSTLDDILEDDKYMVININNGHTDLTREKIENTFF